MFDSSSGRRTFWKNRIHEASYFLGLLTTVPLIVVGLTVIARSHFGWRAILLFSMILVTSWANMVLANLSDINFSLNELVQFKMDFPDLRLMPVPVSDYVRALRNRVPHLRSKRDDQILPSSASLQSSRIRILVASAQEGSHLSPSALVTFANFLGAWIILNETPERLTDIGYFTMLHEIGHTAFVAFISRVASTVAMRNMILPGLFIACMIRLTWTQSAAVVILGGAWSAAAAANQRFVRAHARAYDEINADRFALERSDSKWFESYTDFIKRFAKAEQGSEPFPDTEIWNRANAFTEYLDRIRQGKPLRTLRELLPGSKWGEVEEVLLISLLVTCGLAHAPLSLGRLSILATVAFLASGFAFLCILFISLSAECVDDILGVKPMAPEKMRLMTQVMTRAVALRQRIASPFRKSSTST